MELALCFRNNMLNYFAIYYLKSKFSCFAAFLKRCEISNIARAIFLKYICKIRLLCNQGIFLIEESDCTVSKVNLFYYIVYFLKTLFIPYREVHDYTELGCP